MKYYVGRFKKGWADEFDVHGIRVMDEIEYDAMMKFVDENGEEEINWYFGTNEDWEEPIKFFTSSIKWSTITASEAKTIMDFACDGHAQFGEFPSLDLMMELLEDE